LTGNIWPARGRLPRAQRGVRPHARHSRCGASRSGARSRGQSGCRSRRWREDPGFVAAYDALEEEFAGATGTKLHIGFVPVASK